MAGNYINNKVEKERAERALSKAKRVERKLNMVKWVYKNITISATSEDKLRKIVSALDFEWSYGKLLK